MVSCVIIFLILITNLFFTRRILILITLRAYRLGLELAHVKAVAATLEVVLHKHHSHLKNVIC